MFGNFYLFGLLAIVVVFCVIGACMGLRVRRRRLAQASQADAAYAQFSDQPHTAGMDSNNYANMYYQQQQQQQQSPQVGAVTGTGAGGSGGYYPVGTPMPYTGQQAGGQPMPATVLYAGTTGAQGANINFGNYFPEAQAAPLGASGGGNAGSNNYYGGSGGTLNGYGSPAQQSPYGEADYVSRPPPAMTDTRRPAEGTSPISGGNQAGVPPPQYQPFSEPTKADGSAGKKAS